MQRAALFQRQSYFLIASHGYAVYARLVCEHRVVICRKIFLGFHKQSLFRRPHIHVRHVHAGQHKLVAYANRILLIREIAFYARVSRHLALQPIVPCLALVRLVYLVACAGHKRHAHNLKLSSGARTFSYGYLRTVSSHIVVYVKAEIFHIHAESLYSHFPLWNQSVKTVHVGHGENLVKSPLVILRLAVAAKCHIILLTLRACHACRHILRGHSFQGRVHVHRVRARAVKELDSLQYTERALGFRIHVCVYHLVLRCLPRVGDIRLRTVTKTWQHQIWHIHRRIYESRPFLTVNLHLQRRSVVVFLAVKLVIFVLPLTGNLSPPQIVVITPRQVGRVSVCSEPCYYGLVVLYGFLPVHETAPVLRLAFVLAILEVPRHKSVLCPYRHLSATQHIVQIQVGITFLQSLQTTHPLKTQRLRFYLSAVGNCHAPFW